MDEPEMLTAAEVAALFGVATATVCRWARRGRLQGVQVVEGGDWRLYRDEVAAKLGEAA